MFEGSVTVKGKKLEDYKLIKELGKGTFGVVYLAKQKDDVSGEHFAIKSIKRNPDLPADSSKYEIEYAKWQRQKHENVVSVLDYFSKYPCDYIVMEFCPDGDLNDYIIDKDPTLTSKIDFMRDMAKGLKFLHQNKIIHRDLKPQNILMAKCGNHTICKIADFGVSKVQQSANDLFSTIVGTRYYAAPEVFDGSYTYSADIFALGLVFMAIHIRRMAASSTAKPERYLYPVVTVRGKDCSINTLHREHPEEKTQIIAEHFLESKNLGRLIQEMLHENPSHRPELGEQFLSSLESIQKSILAEEQSKKVQKVFATVVIIIVAITLIPSVYKNISQAILYILILLTLVALILE